MTEKERILVIGDLERLKRKTWSEYVFAKACLQVGHLIVEYQIPINGSSEDAQSVIDFRVTNTLANRYKLVEVTQTPREKLTNTDRKKRQLQNLRQNGKPHTVLTYENLVSICRLNPAFKKNGSGQKSGH